jgi:hypothetical protein
MRQWLALENFRNDYLQAFDIKRLASIDALVGRFWIARIFGG